MIYVVVGSGPAGVVAAERLRKLDPLANISLIGAEPEPPYSRMAIPYFLTDKIRENGTYLRKTAMHFEKLNIELVQKTVTSIDTEFNRLITDDGSVRRYGWYHRYRVLTHQVYTIAGHLKMLDTL